MSLESPDFRPGKPARVAYWRLVRHRRGRAQNAGATNRRRGGGSVGAPFRCRMAQLACQDGSLLLPMDALLAEQWQQSLDQVVAAWAGGSGADLPCRLSADPRHGSWGDVAQRMVDINLGSVYTGSGHVLPQLQAQQCGGIGMIASVADILACRTR